jgi:hypothetical protein
MLKSSGNERDIPWQMQPFAGSIVSLLEIIYQAILIRER